jgi:hypothetical protein
MPGQNLAFLPGQRIEGSGTNITQELPPGGNQGDLLAKQTNADGVVEWIAPPQGLTAGGAPNTIATRNAAGAQIWTNPVAIFPGGSNGQVWTCAAPGVGQWQTLPGPLAAETNSVEVEELKNRIVALEQQVQTLLRRRTPERH